MAPCNQVIQSYTTSTTYLSCKQHTPLYLGNPQAMIDTPTPKLRPISYISTHLEQLLQTLIKTEETAFWRRFEIDSVRLVTPSGPSMSCSLTSQTWDFNDEDEKESLVKYQLAQVQGAKPKAWKMINISNIAKHFSKPNESAQRTQRTLDASFNPDVRRNQEYGEKRLLVSTIAQYLLQA